MAAYFLHNRHLAPNNVIKGSITVACGSFETEIKVDRSIVIFKIYASIEAESPPVCGADVDMVGAVKLDDHTFILYTNIKSNTATVYWLVEY